MWAGGQGGAFVPDSLDDEEGWQVVYGDERADAEDQEPQAGRAVRQRYTLQQASSASKAAAPGRESPAVAAAEGGAASPGHSIGSPRAGTTRQHQPQLTLDQELQTVLEGFTQQQQHDEAEEQQHLALPAGWGAAPPIAQQQRQQQQQQGPAGWQPRRSGVRQIKNTSPAVPPPSLLPPGVPDGSRRWRQAQGAAAGQSPVARLAAAATTAPANTAAGDRFFEVDPDLVAHAQRQLAAAPGGPRQQQRRNQQRTVQWNSPQAADGTAAERTPLPSQRTNPLACLLGGGGGGGTGGGSIARARPATTSSKPRGRHPIYGQAAPPTSASTLPQGCGDSSSSGSRLQDLGLGDVPPTSPRQQQQRRRQAQPQHSRFAILDAQPAADPAAAAPAADVDSSQQAPSRPAAAGGASVAAGLRILTGSEPASAVRQQHFHPRPRRPASPGERIVGDADDEGEQQQQQHVEQQHVEQQPEQAAADGFRTPGQPLRRAWQESEEQQAHAGGCSHPRLGATSFAAAGGAAGVPPDSGGSERSAPGSTGGKGAMTLQRQFIAQLQPVSRPAAAATMQQQRQRLAGAAGLHARMQAILAAEKAGLAQSPGGEAAGWPRLTVLHKELEANLTKCQCRCDAAAAAALGSPEVIALLQNRTAREVDTAPGSVILLREPWRVVPLPDSQWPVVLCYAAAMG